jgi:hypothetical protein
MSPRKAGMQPVIRVAPPGELKVYPVYEHRLDLLNLDREYQVEDAAEPRNPGGCRRGHFGQGRLTGARRYQARQEEIWTTIEGDRIETPRPTRPSRSISRRPCPY